MKLVKISAFFFILVSIFVFCAKKASDVATIPSTETQETPAFRCLNLRISPRQINVMEGGSVMLRWDSEIVPERKCRYIIEIGREYIIKGPWSRKGSRKNVMRSVYGDSLYHNISFLRTSTSNYALYIQCLVYYEDEDGNISTKARGSFGARAGRQQQSVEQE
jgi:hypothetical protein